MKKWFVLYTKPNQELKVARHLEEAGISSYCPTISVIKQYSDRKKKIIKPLISSYVFVQIEERKRNDVFSVFGIVRYIFWLGKPAIVRDSEIESMKKHLNGVYQSISFKKFTRGQIYKISEGLFAGEKGRIIETQKNKIKIELESLGMTVSLRLQAA
tara:strand:- start:10873 stop:11343 length:471 start_codon:yes stop_codon:yes gene_type:complete